jgi:hypothetical protein
MKNYECVFNKHYCDKEISKNEITLTSVIRKPIFNE